jgi:AGZA family xanthine/uracil permease-like MFS transporter
MAERRYKWAALGDANAFFGLMLDNVANLVVLAGILINVFHFPAAIVYTRMFPGTALGVMVGDLVYTWLAFRLAAKTGRDDVTAMPLGLDAPSTIGMAFAVLGPAFKAAHDGGATDDAAAITAWQIGMATMVLIGVFKLIMSFFGNYIAKAVPQAALLGTLAGIGIALLGALQLGELFSEPIVGMVSLGLILYSLVARLKLPYKIPEVFVSVAAGTFLFYGLGALHLTHHPVTMPPLSLTLGFPLPNAGFIYGMKAAAVSYLPVAIPFAVLTVVGGINVTASARLAGDDYDTQEILLTEAIATLVAGVCGGVSQSTPYIGHPAYKAMGGRAAYTLATGLFVGLGGMLGYIPFMAAVLPAAALTPIFVFVGIDIVEQSFVAIPKRYAGAIVVAMFPNVCQLVQIILVQSNFMLTHSAADPEGVAKFIGPFADMKFIHEAGVFTMLAHGFILTGMLWGAVVAFLIDRKGVHATATLLICSVMSLFGVIHSILPDGDLYLPWRLDPVLVPGFNLPYHWAVAYALFAVIVLGLAQTKEFREAAPVPEGH